MNTHVLYVNGLGERVFPNVPYKLGSNAVNEAKCNRPSFPSRIIQVDVYMYTLSVYRVFHQQYEKGKKGEQKSLTCWSTIGRSVGRSVYYCYTLNNAFNRPCCKMKRRFVVFQFHSATKPEVVSVVLVIKTCKKVGDLVAHRYDLPYWTIL